MDNQKKLACERIKLICIACPIGCRLDVEYAEGSDCVVSVSGNKCKRGLLYATQEVTSPTRTVTAVAASDSERVPYVPVRTDKPLPKALIESLLTEIYNIRIGTPLKLGQVIIKNFANSNVNVICTRTVLK